MKRKLIMEFEVVETGRDSCGGCYFDRETGCECPETGCRDKIFVKLNERIEEVVDHGEQ